MEDEDGKEVIALLGGLASKGGARTWRCPGEAELAAYADGQLNQHAKERVEGHLADCGFCLEHVGFLVRLQEEGIPAAVPASLEARAIELGAQKVPLRPTYWWGAVAAAAVVGVLGVVLRSRGPELRAPSPAVGIPSTTARQTPPAPVAPPATPEPSRVRSRPVGPSVPKQLLPRPDSVVRREDVEFRWTAVPRSLFYEVRIATTEGDLVWEGRATATRLRPPNDLRLEAGQKFYFWVAAYLPEGKTVRSPAVAFVVEGGS